MAKSLRAKSSLAAKSIKRKAVFQKTADARVERLAEKLKQNLNGQKKDEELKKGAGTLMEVETAVNAAGAQDAGGINGKDSETKISTSGWRDARHHNYKKSKIMKKSKKKGSFTKF